MEKALEWLLDWREWSAGLVSVVCFVATYELGRGGFDALWVALPVLVAAFVRDWHVERASKKAAAQYFIAVFNPPEGRTTTITATTRPSDKVDGDE